MKRKENCWEFKKCGRNNGKSDDLGICPAIIDESSDGLNGGRNGGRICWVIAGTFCGGKVQGTFAQKRSTCITCDFFKLVEAEEGLEEFKVLKPGQMYNPYEM
jgi:hypothetical protein